MVDCGVYAGGRRRPGEADVGRAVEVAVAESGFVWIGLSQPTAEEFGALQRQLDLPQLAVEDAVKAHQRPKLERYDGVTFAVVKPGRYVDHDEVVELSELAIFLGRDFILTVRHGDTEVPAQVRRDLEADPDLLAHGPAAVLYRCLDLVVDGYLSIVEAIGVDVDQIEDQVFGGEPGEHAERIYKLKREVLEFRRAVVPLVAPVQQLVEGTVPGVAPDTRTYFRDVHDHLLRAADVIEGYDDLLSNVLQADLAQVTVEQNRVSVRQNEDMRKISAWAAIALVPTAIAGIYGMNFEHMPELETRYGYFVVLGVIVAACLGLHTLFRRNDWL